MRVIENDLKRTPVDPTAASIELRLVHADEEDVRNLAALDDAPELEGEVLLALMNGDAVAALSLRSRRVVADPFVRTSDTVELLRLRANLLTSTDKPRLHRLRRILTPRPA